MKLVVLVAVLGVGAVIAETGEGEDWGVIQRLGGAVPAAAPGPPPGPPPPLPWLASLFEPHSWNPSSIPGARLVSGHCRSDIKVYLNALNNHTLWAARMSDASGRYGSEFLFGNQFWLGSKLLCRILQAPFPTAFHVAKLDISLGRTFTPRGKTEVSLGVCLPGSCSSKDLSVLLQEAASPPDPAYSVKVNQVRAVPGPYSLGADPKLHVLIVVMAMVLVLMAWGTLYEVVVDRRRASLHRANNNQADLKLGVLEKITFHKLEAPAAALDADPYHRLGLLRRTLLCFSVATNGKKILNCGEAPNEPLSCLHGLRFYSLAWVIMAHTYLQIFAVAENKGRKLVAEENFLFQTITNATFSVDTFFFISGLLVTYVFIKSALKVRRQTKPLFIELKTMICKFFTLIGYRFIRLTPAYLFVLMLAELSMLWIKNNSVFEPTADDDVTCHVYWWRNLLYINSLFPRSEMCMLWSWYLANDTQLYILGIFFLVLSARFFKTSAASLLILLVSSSVTCAVIAVKYGYLVRIEDRFMLFDELYDKPWTRIGPYIMGMFTGYLLTRSKISISKRGAVWGWVLSLGAMAALVYGVRDARLDVAGSAAYISLGHVTWGAALGWIVVACSTGHGGYINGVLSCPLLHPLGRLTYCAYLIHPIIMRLTSFQMEGALHLSSLLSVILFFGNIVAAFFASFFISLMFEAPVVRLLKVFLPPPRQPTNT